MPDVNYYKKDGNVKTKKPLYKHDCKKCQFLKTIKTKVDLYFCERELIPVVRRSNNGSDYSSGFEVNRSEIKEDIKIALKKGLTDNSPKKILSKNKQGI